MMDPTNPLTPSELVYLNGEHFANKARFNTVKLLSTDTSVSESQLGQAMLAVAILANEKFGAVRLELRKKSALFGIRKVESLYADPTGHPISWPAGSLEAEILRLAERLSVDRQTNEISRMIYTWLERDSTSPWKSVVEKVQAGMASRGLLEAYEEKKLKVFTVTRYELPSSTVDLINKVSVDQTKQLLDDCENLRPHIWKQLVNQLKSAIRNRTEQSD